MPKRKSKRLTMWCLWLDGVGLIDGILARTRREAWRQVGNNIEIQQYRNGGYRVVKCAVEPAS